MVNNGNAPLEIKKVRVSCGCLTANVSQKVILPGQSASLQLELGTNRFKGLKTMLVFVLCEVEGESFEFRVEVVGTSVEESKK